MAQNRQSGTALAGPTRWLGGGAVALIHLCFLLAFLLTDQLTFHKSRDVRPMEVYRIAEDRRPEPAPRSIGTPSKTTLPSAVMTPRLDGPMILIQPEKPLPPALRGLDLSPPPLSGIRPMTQDDLLPSKQARVKQFFKDQAAENSLAREPSAGEDCEVAIASQQQAASLGSAFKDPLPVYTVCTPRSSAKDLSKRNDRFAPQ